MARIDKTKMHLKILSDDRKNQYRKFFRLFKNYSQKSNTIYWNGSIFLDKEGNNRAWCSGFITKKEKNDNSPSFSIKMGNEFIGAFWGSNDKGYLTGNIELGGFKTRAVITLGSMFSMDIYVEEVPSKEIVETFWERVSGERGSYYKKSEQAKSVLNKKKQSPFDTDEDEEEKAEKDPLEINEEKEEDPFTEDDEEEVPEEFRNDPWSHLNEGGSE